MIYKNPSHSDTTVVHVIQVHRHLKKNLLTRKQVNQVCGYSPAKALYLHRCLYGELATGWIAALSLTHLSTTVESGLVPFSKGPKKKNWP